MNREPVKSPWLPFGTASDAQVRLVCLPHAGAGAAAYRSWGAGSHDAVAVCPVRPPGREKRWREPALTSAVELACQLAPEIIADTRPPYALFGHCTGALVAFELSRQIRRLGGTEPVHLFVSGSPAPQLPVHRRQLSSLTVSEIAALLGRLGGTPQEVLDNDEILAQLRPLLVADFKISDDYAYEPEKPLTIPLTVFAATQDVLTNLDQAAAWKVQAAGEFRIHTLDGNHFAVFDKASETHDQIAKSLRMLS